MAHSREVNTNEKKRKEKKTFIESAPQEQIDLQNFFFFCSMLCLCNSLWTKIKRIFVCVWNRAQCLWRHNTESNIVIEQNDTNEWSVSLLCFWCCFLLLLFFSPFFLYVGCIHFQCYSVKFNQNQWLSTLEFSVLNFISFIRFPFPFIGWQSFESRKKQQQQILCINTICMEVYMLVRNKSISSVNVYFQ